MTDFEQKVLADLSELRVHMRWLVGNGNQGRVQEMERRLDEHEAFVQRAGGIGAALGILFTLVHFGIHFMRLNH